MFRATLRRFTLLTLLAAAALHMPGIARAEAPDLAEYFGFTGLEVVKIGRNAGPIAIADMDGDELNDLIAVNNAASRIEIHFQKADASPDDVEQTNVDVNEFPEHWRFRRENLSITYSASAIVPHDFDDDGMLDLVYGSPDGQIVFIRQVSPGRFERTRRNAVRNLGANRNGMAIANVVGDEAPDLIALVAGNIHVWEMNGDRIGQPVAELAAGGNVVGFTIADFNGDGRQDIVGIIPEDAAPVRLWLGENRSGQRALSAQIRFETPGLIEFEAVHLPGRDTALLALIERVSKRLSIAEIVPEPVEAGGSDDAALRVHNFTDAGNRERDLAVLDVDGDGGLDLLATDTRANTVVFYRQREGQGIGGAEPFPTFKEVTYIAAGNVDDDPQAELFVLSEEEAVVGRSDVTASGSIPYPTPIAISEGYEPVAMNLVQLETGPHVAVVSESGREYVVDIISMDGDRQTVDLDRLSRAPQSVVALDADQDGRTDLLLFTRDKPMTMLHATDEGLQVVQSDTMGQFGLVKAAEANNIAPFDIDGDGRDELLIADENFVRAVRYDLDPEPGVAAGWQVVEQINASDPSADLVSLAVMGDRIVAADQRNSQFLIMEPGDDGRWREARSVRVRGFTFDAIHAGAFSGDGREEQNILAVNPDGFAVVRLSGERLALQTLQTWRTPEEHRQQHELGVGDLNRDGFVDLVTLDSGEQMAEIFTFTETGQLLYAMGFQVFESRLFTGGEGRVYEPSVAIVEDLTGDGADDLILLAHDRVLLYPQMTQ